MRELAPAFSEFDSKSSTGQCRGWRGPIRETGPTTARRSVSNTRRGDSRCRALPLTPDLDVAFTQALDTAPRREIAPERANGKPQGSRIVSAANAQIATGIVGAVSVAGAAIAPAIEAAEQAKDIADRAIGLLNLTEFVAPFLPWIGIAIFAVVIFLAWRARAARIEDFRTGKTP